jgi:hypothetical protein
MDMSRSYWSSATTIGPRISLMALHSLPVALRGTRDYVQGSQILARTAEVIAEGTPSATLQTAKFTRITDRGVEVAIGDGESAGPEIGTARFTTADGPITARFFEVPGDQAPPIDDVPRATAELATGPGGAGRCTYAIRGDFESYLAAVIEFVKAVHAARADQVTDIWFTALAGAALPLDPVYATRGSMTLEPKVERMAGDRLQTLGVLSTKTDADGAGPPPFQISFSCVTA